MDTITARPRLLKQANLSLIRKVIKSKGTATRAEIAAETKISSTTVRSLLAEMMENGEIQGIGHDESSGGRKAERYGFKPDQYYGAEKYKVHRHRCARHRRGGERSGREPAMGLNCAAMIWAAGSPCGIISLSFWRMI